MSAAMAAASACLNPSCAGVFRSGRVVARRRRSADDPLRSETASSQRASGAASRARHAEVSRHPESRGREGPPWLAGPARGRVRRWWSFDVEFVGAYWPPLITATTALSLSG